MHSIAALGTDGWRWKLGKMMSVIENHILTQITKINKKGYENK